MISNKCVNPETKRPYPVSIIEKAMKECHIAVKPNKSSKQQALDTIGKLKPNLPIERAMMRMKVVVPIKTANKMRKYLSKQDQNVKIETEEKEGEEMVITLLASPGLYRDIESTVRDETQVKLIGVFKTFFSTAKRLRKYSLSNGQTRSCLISPI